MSQSPTELESSGSSAAYRGGLNQVAAMIRQGMSWSGSERNCTFLNTRGRRFADVSSASGLDFADDGRGAAVVDWNHDGRCDLVLANRTAPRLRFLLNEVAGEHQFLSLKLQGTSCNRDAIGTRVEIVVRAPGDADDEDAEGADPEGAADTPGATGPRTVKTLRAGEGFLSQSSKWLHFGIAQGQSIERIVVDWPDGQREEIAGVAANRHYRLVQGSGALTPWTPPTERPAWQPSPFQPPAAPARHNVLTVPVRLPVLRYRSYQGQEKSLQEDQGAYVLLTLWSKTCQPCLRELKQWSAEADEIRGQGLEILAICVDSLTVSDATAGQDFVETIAWPFAAGVATPALVDVLQITSNWIYEPNEQLQVPCSFLIDRQGRLKAIYQGSVPLERVVADSRRKYTTAGLFRPTAVPFPGRWLYAQELPRFIRLASALVEGGHLDETVDFLARNRLLLAKDPDYPNVLVHVAAQLRRQDRVGEAVEHYRLAIAAAPEFWAAQNDLAWTLATTRDGAVRDPRQAIRLAESVDRATNHQNPSVLDTLATAQAANGDFETAVRTVRQALELARGQQPALVSSLERRLASFERGEPFVE
ncbi:MAG: hypothetical protein DWQ42_13430 [Planctomycetota bacterium]|nr:MAG: hypothetical protein DWQ42_13430 [Planctomycetota bacterium]REK45974.1 MAG: hypothetical protein DWQ46_07715 [Planctomycetota bacterium]